MNLVIALFLVLIGTGITLVANLEYSVWYKQLMGWILFIGLIIGSLYVYQRYTESIKYTYETHEWYLQSLGNDKYMEGHFGLFTGTIDEIDYYFFYVNTIHGLTRNKVKLNETYIIETDERVPEMVTVNTGYNDDDKFWKILFDDFEYNIMYVPKGTVIRNFKVR